MSLTNKLNIKLLNILLLLQYAKARVFCDGTKMPFEDGEWKSNLKHIDSVVVENQPVNIPEGQKYVYHNNFPEYVITYINIDNLAIKTCGASAVIKEGGIGTSSLLIILHAEHGQEIRTVIDIWGKAKDVKHNKTTTKPPPVALSIGSLQKNYENDKGTINHHKLYRFFN